MLYCCCSPQTPDKVLADLCGSAGTLVATTYSSAHTLIVDVAHKQRCPLGELELFATLWCDLEQPLVLLEVHMSKSLNPMSKALAHNSVALCDNRHFVVLCFNVNSRFVAVVLPIKRDTYSLNQICADCVLRLFTATLPAVTSTSSTSRNKWLLRCCCCLTDQDVRKNANQVKCNSHRTSGGGALPCSHPATNYACARCKGFLRHLVSFSYLSHSVELSSAICVSLLVFSRVRNRVDGSSAPPKPLTPPTKWHVA